MSKHVRRSLMVPTPFFTPKWNYSNLLESLNTMTDGISCFSIKVFRDIMIRHSRVIFNQKLVFFGHPRKMFLFTINSPKISRSSLVRRNHSLPFSLHHKTFSIFLQKLSNAIRHMHSKVKSFICGPVPDSNSNRKYTCLYSYFSKFIGNLFKPFPFGRSDFITGFASLSNSFNSAVRRQQTSKPNYGFPKFLFACQSSHREKDGCFINLKDRGE